MSTCDVGKNYQRHGFIYLKTIFLLPVLSDETFFILLQRYVTYIGSQKFMFDVLQLILGHRGEISNAVISYDDTLIGTGSMDKSCKVSNRHR